MSVLIFLPTSGLLDDFFFFFHSLVVMSNKGRREKMFDQVNIGIKWKNLHLQISQNMLIDWKYIWYHTSPNI